MDDGIREMEGMGMGMGSCITPLRAGLAEMRGPDGCDRRREGVWDGVDWEGIGRRVRHGPAGTG